jgi:hypothetical protein
MLNNRKIETIGLAPFLQYAIRKDGSFIVPLFP